MLTISKFQQLTLGSMAIASAVVVSSMPAMAGFNTNNSNNGGTNVSNQTGTNVSNQTGTNASNASGAAREYKTRFRNNNPKPDQAPNTNGSNQTGTNASNQTGTNASNQTGTDREYKAKFRAEIRAKAIW